MLVCIMWACHPEHNEGHFQPALALNFKASAQYSSGTTPVSLATLIYIGTLVPPFQLATPPDSSHPHPEGEPRTKHQMHVVLDICTLFSGARESFLAFSAVGHTGGPPVHHGASVGSGQAPWCVLWVFKVAKSGK